MVAVVTKVLRLPRLLKANERKDVVKFGIGDSVRRVEDQQFITGRGRYVDDINLPRQCYGVIVHSPHAYAGIRRVDTHSRPLLPAFQCGQSILPSQYPSL
jgi:xanthine dehydrogenase molybdopterin-binding subunit B